MAPGFMEKFYESHLWAATEMEESFVYALAHNGINEMNGISAGRAHLKDLMSVEGKRALFQYERLFYNMLDAFCPAIIVFGSDGDIRWPPVPAQFIEAPGQHLAGFAQR